MVVILIERPTAATAIKIGVVVANASQVVVIDGDNSIKVMVTGSQYRIGSHTIHNELKLLHPEYTEI